MEFFYSDVANLPAVGSTYNGYCDFQLFDEMNCRETLAAKETTVDSTDSNVSSCHRYPHFVDAQYELQPSFESNIERWIEDNERIRAQGFRYTSDGVSDTDMRVEIEKEEPALQNPSPKKRFVACFQAKLPSLLLVAQLVHGS